MEDAPKHKWWYWTIRLLAVTVPAVLAWMQARSEAQLEARSEAQSAYSALRDDLMEQGKAIEELRNHAMKEEGWREAVELLLAKALEPSKAEPAHAPVRTPEHRPPTPHVTSAGVAKASDVPDEVRKLEKHRPAPLPSYEQKTLPESYKDKK